MQNIRLKILFPLLVLSALLHATPATASDSGNTCSLSIAPLIFGNYNPLDTQDTTTQTTLEIDCKEAVDLTIALSTGQSGSYTARSMVGPHGVQLHYNLYTHHSAQTIWGDGTGNTTTYSHTNNPHLRKAIFGILPAGQNQISAGHYEDTIVVTVTY